MRISLVLHVFNKETTIRSLIESWLHRLSGSHTVDVVVVCDDLTDRSDVVARDTLDGCGIPYRILRTLNAWEMGADNLGAAVAGGDLLVFVQDDNWMFTPSWDDTLVSVFEFLPHAGAVGLLAGVVWQADGTYRRVEGYTPHKGAHFDRFNLPRNAFAPGLWQVDYVTRPFAMRRSVFEDLRGLDWAYWPMDWDESDLSWRAHRMGLTNVVATFDVLNTVGKQDTVGRRRMTENFVRGRKIYSTRYGATLQADCLGGRSTCLARFQVTHRRRYLPGMDLLATADEWELNLDATN